MQTVRLYFPAPVAGADFSSKAHDTDPASAVLFVCQAGYPAKLTTPFALDAINGNSNESSRWMEHASDQKFSMLVQRVRDLQVAKAVQAHIERCKQIGVHLLLNAAVGTS